jgi:tyrosine-protein phosphatase SIW14
VYRDEYTYQKRLRIVDAERGVYRMGQGTARGFRDAVHDLKIRTVVNLQEDAPDPDIAVGYWTFQTIKESELCKELGVQYVQINTDLVPRGRVREERPRAIDEFLAVMDDPKNYPVLFHCHAGLHRTGRMAAIYRMEYQGWSQDAAWCEMRAHGYGEWACTASDDYIMQYLLTYKPHLRRTPDGEYVTNPGK